MNDDGDPEIFRGYLQECFGHLAQTIPKGTAQAAKIKSLIAKFCGTGQSSVSRWCRGDTMPLGIQRPKAMCCLTLLGYCVLEWRAIKTVYRGFAELIGFGLLTEEEAVNSLGYAKAASLYQIFYAKVGAGDEKSQRMWDIYKARKETLEARKTDARRNLQEVIEHVRTSGGSGEVTKIHLVKNTSPAQSKAAALISIMSGLSTMLEQWPAADLSQEGWSAGAGIVLKLSAQLSTLGSKLVSHQNAEKRGGNDG